MARGGDEGIDGPPVVARKRDPGPLFLGIGTAMGEGRSILL